MTEPAFTMLPEDSALSTDESAAIQCSIIGKPTPNVFWKSPDRNILLPSDRVSWTHPEPDQYNLTVTSN